MNKTKTSLLGAALAVSLAVNTVQWIGQGEPVPGLEAVADFSIAFADTSSDFNRMVTYDREIPDSWHKVFTGESFPDTMVVAMWPLKEMVCLFPRPVHVIEVTDPKDAARLDIWFSASTFTEPAVGDTLEWVYTYAPADSIVAEGTWMRGNDCWLLTARRP